MFQIFSWVSHRGHRELGGADVGLPASVQLPSAMRAFFQIMRLFFQGGGFKGTKKLHNRYIFVGYGEMLDHPYVIFGLEIHIMGLQCVGQKAGG